MKDKPIEANRLLTIWATPDGKARATQINTPAAEHFLDISGAYPALLAEILLKEAIALQLQAIAKEENATKEAVFQAFIQELAAELRISDAQINADTQPQFTGAVSPVQGTPLATVCMNDDGHLNVAINPDIGAIMGGHNPSDSRILQDEVHSIWRGVATLLPILVGQMRVAGLRVVLHVLRVQGVL